MFIDNVQIVASPPAAPASLSGTAGNLQVNLQWSSVGGIIGYHINKSVGGGASSIVQGNGTATSYTDVSVTNGTTYTYNVAAFNDSGDGSPSNSVIAIPAPPVSAVEASAPSLTMTGTGGGVNAHFSVQTSVLGHTYQLQYSDSLASGTWQNVPSVTPQAGTGNALQFTIPINLAVSQRFYRILIQP